MCKNKNLTEKHSLILHKKKYIKMCNDKLRMLHLLYIMLPKLKKCVPLTKNLYDEVLHAL